MIHRHTLMPTSMRSTKKSCNISGTNNQLTDVNCAISLLNNYFDNDDDRIIVVEPTDPDEDRLKEEAKLQAKIEPSSSLSQVNSLPPFPFTSTSKSSSTPTLSASPVTHSSELPSTEARITICTDPGKPISVIPLNETLQSILTCTNRTTFPNMSVQPLIPSRIASTPCMMQNPIGTVWLHSPIQSSAAIASNNMTNIDYSIQPSALLNPLVSAVLVTCATEDIINQLTGPLCTTQTPNTYEQSILVPKHLPGPIIPSLPSGIHLSTTPTMITPNCDNILVPASLQTRPVDFVASAISPLNQVSKFKLVENRLVPRAGRVKRFKCPIPNCEMTFYSRFNQTEHIRCHTGERPFRCPEMNCRAAFKRKRDLRDHWNMHLTDRQLTCSTIEEEFEKALREASERPKDTSNGESVEPVTQSTETEMESQPIHENVGNVKGFETTPEGLYLEHGRHRCTYPGCDKSYARRHRLNQHVAAHTGVGPIHCDEPNCHVRYFSVEDLRRHKMNHLYVPDRNCRRRHGCPYPNCGKAYSKLNKLKEHLRSHTGERPYICREPGCGASFIRLYGVKRHELTHLLGRKRVRRLARFPTTLAKVIDGSAFENNYVGDCIDNPTTATKSDTNYLGDRSSSITVASVFSESIKTPQVGSVTISQSLTSRNFPAIAPRTNQTRMRPISPLRGAPGIRRPHICPFKECGRAFPKLNKLREHICRHTGERPFACDECSASFVRVYDLRRHSNIHLRRSETRIHSRPLAPRGTSAISVATSLPVTTAVTTTT